MDDKADKTKETKRPSSMQQETNISRESGEALELKRSRLCDLWQDGTISDIEKVKNGSKILEELLMEPTLDEAQIREMYRLLAHSLFVQNPTHHAKVSIVIFQAMLAERGHDEVSAELSKILDSHLQFLETEAGSSAFDALVNLELENQGR
ncbi:hypothetical protein MGG_05012 [Pyricularia oryzae 70-15]|uniref:Uncharacterized protein n=1 Tax=Pyricularia oryzae (strain 70-15 / ATCC MYA-4617 / FGSC 8958) TaxID=242507 RepID=G4N3T6_PYRO7|nr:uncharacterized protein MGG_05012 [Pyricularia oryzae 70-15]EHA52709.1 hypothetical protein MGG_05012 [Pyricularia oryzae 70-15]KAI7925060.1 hypothetical protein M9X92_003435 [Pyricularia oryzae]KAI7929031.1 hypothetical protein M0657_002467 [Pyricularia oryzae]